MCQCVWLMDTFYMDDVQFSLSPLLVCGHWHCHLDMRIHVCEWMLLLLILLTKVMGAQN